MENKMIVKFKVNYETRVLEIDEGQLDELQKFIDDYNKRNKFKLNFATELDYLIKNSKSLIRQCIRNFWAIDDTGLVMETAYVMQYDTKLLKLSDTHYMLDIFNFENFEREGN